MMRMSISFTKFRLSCQALGPLWAIQHLTQQREGAGVVRQKDTEIQKVKGMESRGPKSKGDGTETKTYSCTKKTEERKWKWK